jgi:hypothetical protein
MNPGPEYPGQSPVYYPTPVSTSTTAVISLISGILAWIGVFGLGGILAVIFGHIAKGEIRKSNGAIGGNGMATVGLVLGYANIAITLMGICFFILMIAGIVTIPVCLLPFSNGINPGN